MVIHSSEQNNPWNLVLHITPPLFAFALPLQSQGSRLGGLADRRSRGGKLQGSTDADVAMSLVANTQVVINAARSDRRGVSASCHTRLSLLHTGASLLRAILDRPGSWFLLRRAGLLDRGFCKAKEAITSTCHYTPTCT